MFAEDKRYNVEDKRYNAWLQEGRDNKTGGQNKTYSLKEKGLGVLFKDETRPGVLSQNETRLGVLFASRLCTLASPSEKAKTKRLPVV